MTKYRVARVVSASIALSLAAVVGVSVGGCSSDPQGDTRPYQLVWSDEFDGTALDDSKWTIETGSSFGTQQLDFDTARADNISVSGGNLVFTARKESYNGDPYTSGRMKTDGKFSRVCGRFEARLKMPKGIGMWPAFWLLGSDENTVPWPGCGEIDVMENRGSEPSTIHGSLHGPGYSGGGAFTESYTLPNGGVFSDDFHIFAVEWDAGELRWYVDDTLYQTRTSDTLARSKTWVFDDKAFFMILDLAIGGVYGPAPDATTVFPQTMLVDYVRVYARGGV